MIRGRCLCGGVHFEVDAVSGPFELCHCSRCRRVSGSAFLAGVYVEAKGFRLTAGSELIRSYEAPILERPPAYRASFCSVCGSPVPDPSADPGTEWLEIPAGLLDDDPGVRPDKHLILGANAPAPWYEITDALPRMDQAQLEAYRRRRWLQSGG